MIFFTNIEAVNKSSHDLKRMVLSKWHQIFSNLKQHFKSLANLKYQTNDLDFLIKT